MPQTRPGHLLLLLLVGCQVLVGCGPKNGYTLPDRADPAVVAEEERIGAIVRASGDAVVFGSSGGCALRLLGRDGSRSYAWARCGLGQAGPGSSGPVVVDGDAVLTPGDGAGYDDDVRRLFPAPIARAILRGEEALLP